MSRSCQILYHSISCFIDHKRDSKGDKNCEASKIDIEAGCENYFESHGFYVDLNRLKKYPMFLDLILWIKNQEFMR